MCDSSNSSNSGRGVLSTQTSIDAVQRLEHLPIASLDSRGPIEFVLPGSVDASLDPANSYLFERAKVIQADGMNLDASEPVGPVNNETRDLLTNTYPYCVYIETALRYSREANDT